MENRAEAEYMGAQGEMKIAEMVALVWASKLWIILATVVATAAGVAYALLATPVYSASGTIAPKETQGSNSGGFLSQFGGLGGMVASSVGGAGGNPIIDRVEIILKGNELATTVIEEHSLLPLLFPKSWDAKKGVWKTTGKWKGPPPMRKAADYLRQKVLVVKVTSKKKLINVGARTYDSTLSAQIATYYIQALNKKIQRDVLAESELNRNFLGEQLSKTPDPLLREKIQNLLSLEIEKSMLVSSNSFDILEKPLVPSEKVEPKRKKIVILAFLLGLAVSSGGFIGWKQYGHLASAMGKSNPSRVA